MAALCACRQQPNPAPASREFPAKEASKPAAVADARPAIACFGDSLTAGFGVDTGKSFPDLLQQELDRRGYHYRVINFGVSGDTSQDGLARIGLVLAEKPAIVILEFGGNDGLRGFPIAVTKSNLARMLEAIRNSGAREVLAGITLPPNYGAEYISKFEAMYRDLAAKYQATLIPFLLEGVAGNSRLMQRDGLHPTAEGTQVVARTVWGVLEPLMRR